MQIQATQLTRGSLGLPKSTLQIASRSDRISRFSTADRILSLYFTLGRGMSPQNCPFPWGLGPRLNTWLLGPTRVYNSNGILISSAVLGQLMLVTNRHTETDHATSTLRGHIFALCAYDVA